MKRLTLAHSLKVYQHNLGTAGEKSRATYRQGVREGEWKREKGQIGGEKLTGSHRQGVITHLNDILGNEYMSITGQNRAKNASRIGRSYRQGKGMEQSRNGTQLNIQGQLTFKFELE